MVVLELEDCLCLKGTEGQRTSLYSSEKDLAIEIYSSRVTAL